MKAQPAIGDFYRQEFSLTNAEDLAEVKSLSAPATVPFSSRILRELPRNRGKLVDCPGRCRAQVLRERDRQSADDRHGRHPEREIGAGSDPHRTAVTAPGSTNVFIGGVAWEAAASRRSSHSTRRRVLARMGPVGSGTVNSCVRSILVQRSPTYSWSWSQPRLSQLGRKPGQPWSRSTMDRKELDRVGERDDDDETPGPRAV